MIVAGIMSGTSADGVNVAVIRVVERPGSSRPFTTENLSFKLVTHAEFPYPQAVRRAVLDAMNAKQIGVAQLAKLNFLLAELYAESVITTQRRFGQKIQLIGCHGQTLYHQGIAADFLGRKLSVTWQIGEGAVIAARVRVPVVSDFRPADMAAGGRGAPLVPFLDYFLYRSPRIGRIIQNIGGIANLTAISAGAPAEKVIAFDTGPGNMVIDAVSDKFFGKRYDRDGKFAASGIVLENVVNEMLRESFFLRKPPKTAGREEFGREFVLRFVKRCGRVPKQDIVATATALTARSIADAVQRFVIRGHGRFAEHVVSGGGGNNPTLLAMLANELCPLGIKLRSSDEFGLPSEAKEAAAFALMAFETWNRRPSNVPAATGAKRPAILGKISYV